VRSCGRAVGRLDDARADTGGKSPTRASRARRAVVVDVDRPHRTRLERDASLCVGARRAPVVSHASESGRVLVKMHVYIWDVIDDDDDDDDDDACT